MALLIKGGRVVTAEDDMLADVYCEGETISRIAPAIEPGEVAPGAEVIDARGKLVFPGFIDPHVHIHLPFMGTHARDDHDSASRAALAGGTTTLIEMICPGPSDEPLEAFETWLGKAQAGSAADYTFHMGVARFDETAQSQLREIVKRGVASFKVFLAYKGAWATRTSSAAWRWPRSRASSSRRTARTPRWSTPCSAASSPRARPARSGTSPAVRPASRPRASTTSAPSPS